MYSRLRCPVVYSSRTTTYACITPACIYIGVTPTRVQVPGNNERSKIRLDINCAHRVCRCRNVPLPDVRSPGLPGLPRSLDAMCDTRDIRYRNHLGVWHRLPRNRYLLAASLFLLSAFLCCNAITISYLNQTFHTQHSFISRVMEF